MTGIDPIELLSELVAIDSQNPEPGESEIVGFIGDLATSLGFDTRTYEAAPGRPNLLVTVDAGPGPSLGLSGHLDTKPIGLARDVWRTPPLELTIDGDVGYGLGTSDMKGAVGGGGGGAAALISSWVRARSSRWTIAGSGRCRAIPRSTSCGSGETRSAGVSSADASRSMARSRSRRAMDSGERAAKREHTGPSKSKRTQRALLMSSLI
jgi:hypothetical protein